VPSGRSKTAFAWHAIASAFDLGVAAAAALQALLLKTGALDLALETGAACARLVLMLDVAALQALRTARAAPTASRLDGGTVGGAAGGAAGAPSAIGVPATGKTGASGASELPSASEDASLHARLPAYALGSNSKNAHCDAHFIS
jgi:hypothetical protein